MVVHLALQEIAFTTYSTLSMLRLLSPMEKKYKRFCKPSKARHVDIPWIALAEHSQMSSYLLGFQSYFSFFALFCIGKIKISHQQHKG